MPVESQSISEETLGSLRGCLVEGDPEQRTRQRRLRRRSFAISIALQTVVLAALVLVPLFAKPEHIVIAGDVVPIPPYTHHAGADRAQPQPSRPRTHNFQPCVVCPTPTVLNHPPIDDPTPPTIDDGPTVPGFPRGDSSDHNGLLNNPDSRPQPVRPHEDPPRQPHRISVTHLEQAMLVHRVEPLYPILPRQMGRGGHVELRAIIATDGTIQSLQVVRGDALFYQSALDAVRQWRYRPTILNGQPFEVDTFITVEYTMQR
jgi:protein TonB